MSSYDNLEKAASALAERAIVGRKIREMRKAASPHAEAAIAGMPSTFQKITDALGRHGSTAMDYVKAHPAPFIGAGIGAGVGGLSMLGSEHQRKHTPRNMLLGALTGGLTGLGAQHFMNQAPVLREQADFKPQVELDRNRVNAEAAKMRELSTPTKGLLGAGVGVGLANEGRIAMNDIAKPFGTAANRDALISGLESEVGSSHIPDDTKHVYKELIRRSQVPSRVPPTPSIMDRLLRRPPQPLPTGYKNPTVTELDDLLTRLQSGGGGATTPPAGKSPLLERLFGHRQYDPQQPGFLGMKNYQIDDRYTGELVPEKLGDPKATPPIPTVPAHHKNIPYSLTTQQVQDLIAKGQPKGWWSRHSGRAGRFLKGPASRMGLFLTPAMLPMLGENMVGNMRANSHLTQETAKLQQAIDKAKK